MRIAAILWCAGALVVAPSAHAQTINIAAAADLKFCLDEIIGDFHNSHPAAEIHATYGSSGNFAAQIRQNAPFDLFFSADIDYPRELAKDGFATAEVRPYAVGRIVLWSTTIDASKLSLADLARPQIEKIAIANPQHAPYGKRAEEALRTSGVWDQVQTKLVFGENIAQTAQFVQSSNAQVGIVALSLALNPQLKGSYTLIPDTLHKPLEQAFVITKHGADNPLAHAFADYLLTPAARRVMLRYGFALPGEAVR